MGICPWEMPLSEAHLNQLHSKYDTQEAIEHQLIRTVVEKAVYMTGPLMNSKESAAERRNEPLQYIEDQVQNGVYRTETHQEKQFDPMTGKEKTVSVVKLVMEKGQVVRSDESPLKTFGIRTFNPSLNQIKYDDQVEGQIKEQQKMYMAVQTAMAEAKQAEQAAITAEKNGQAEAAKAKWLQEVIKAKVLTEAQQQLEAAILKAKTAEQIKREQILLGEGEAKRRWLVMQADGALDKKLEAQVKINQFWAEAFKHYQGQLVPSVVMGGSGSNSNATLNAQQVMELIGLKAAKDLALDSGVTRGKKANGVAGETNKE